MHYLTEDPTYPLLALGLAAMICLVALRVTQRGKFLIWAAALLGIGVAWLAVERLIVTDAERVEAVVYEIAAAVGRSDPEGVEALLAPEVTFGRKDRIDGIIPIRSLLPSLHLVRFDFVKVRQLDATAGAQTRRGKAEFKVSASGVVLATANFGVEQPFAVTNTEWSFGFRETAPGVWRVTRVTSISLPRYLAPYITGGAVR